MRALLYFLPFIFVTVFAIAGSDTIPTRSNGQTITADWSNLFKRVLDGDFLPRNSSGVVTDKGGNLGSSTYNWETVQTEGLKLRQPSGTNQITIAAPSPVPSPYTVTLPGALPASALPLSMSTAGVISAAQIATAQIADGAVTPEKQGAANYASSASSGAFSTASNPEVDITNLSVSITTHGRPVFVFMTPDGNTTNNSLMQDGVANPTVLFYRGATKIARYEFMVTNDLSPSLVYLDVPAAGTYTYKAAVDRAAGTGLFVCYYMKLHAIEL